MSATDDLHDTTGPQMGTSSAEASAESIIEAINRPRNATDDAFHKNRLPYLELPGFGSDYDDCGEPVPHFCDGCGHCTNFGRTCYRSICPRCGEQWTRRQATSIAAKMDAIRRYEFASRPGNVFFHHLAISLPNDGEDWELDTEEPLNRTFETVKEILEELDCRGAIFYHPLRGADGDDEDEYLDDDRGFWKSVLFEQLDWSDVQKELKFSPHFHAVVSSQHVPGGQITKKIEEETGWIIERITKRDSNVSISNDHDLARVVSYCLSHTGLYETENGNTKAAYRWFGSVGSKSVNQITADEENTDRIDAIVREIAPRTLGIPWERMACSITHETTETLADIRLSAEREFMSRFDHVTSSSTDESESEETETEPDVAKKTKERECNGRIKHIGKASDYLADEDWRENVPHYEKTRKAFREYRREQAKT